MLTGLASFFVVARVNMFDVCAFPVRILFMLLPIMVISTMLNYAILEVLSGINLSRSAMGHQLSVWIYCPRTLLNMTVVLMIGLLLEMVKEIWQLLKLPRMIALLQWDCALLGQLKWRDSSWVLIGANLWDVGNAFLKSCLDTQYLLIRCESILWYSSMSVLPGILIKMSVIIEKNILHTIMKL